MDPTALVSVTQEAEMIRFGTLSFSCYDYRSYTDAHLSAHTQMHCHVHVCTHLINTCIPESQQTYRHVIRM